ncbi:uncharacterized protein LOC109403814 isoform X2 [Aedes albopictus]|uniref:Secreted protein n=1 Tax=Aedes albopictus TaxID=7160 RepID=A0ABM1ZKJ1_AEDAL|nr:uncharacterized protein LOC109403814 isoform X2 [Aedes albopictus]
MSGIKMEVKTIWILVLLVYSNDGEFYDTNNSVSINADDAAGNNNLHSIVTNREFNDSDEPNNANNRGKGLPRAEINFLAKLRQRQRQGQIIPAMDMSLGNQQKLQSPPPEVGYDSDWQDLLVELLSKPPDNEDHGYRSLEEDLGTIVRFLAQQQEHPLVEDASRLSPLSSSGGELSASGQKRAAALRTSMSRRSHTFPYSKERFSPSISVGELYGALTNLGDFFQHLKHNLESLESKNLSKDQVKLLEGENMISNLRKGRIYSRLPQACWKCSLSTRLPELPPLERNPSPGVVRARFVPGDQLSRSGVQTGRTGKVMFPLIHRPLPLLSC